VRNGTTTIFAASDILDGTVSGRRMVRHARSKFIRFLNAAERAVPVGGIVHAIGDDYAMLKHPGVRKRLADYPRWVFHSIPISASWLNAVERFFSTIARRRIRRGIFTSVSGPKDANRRHINEHNQPPRPFVRARPTDVVPARIGWLPVPLE
jgi:hypothetical protein